MASSKLALVHEWQLAIEGSLRRSILRNPTGSTVYHVDEISSWALEHPSFNIQTCDPVQALPHGSQIASSLANQIQGMVRELAPASPPLAQGPLGMPNHLFDLGLAPRPLVQTLSRSLALWSASGSFPFPQVEDVHPPELQEAACYWKAKQEMADDLIPNLQKLLAKGMHIRWEAVHEADHRTLARGIPEPQVGPCALEQGGLAEEADHRARLSSARGGVQSHPLHDVDVDAAEDAPAIEAWRCGGMEEVAVELEGPLDRLLRDVLQDHVKVFVLLGCRVTTGTSQVPAHMPGVHECLEAFVRRHSPASKSPLTVGARALAKHNHRDASSSWWGSCTGSEPAKNEAALVVLSRILAGAVWVNLHHLPPDKSVLEVRVQEGYGARWEVEQPLEAGACPHLSDALGSPVHVACYACGTSSSTKSASSAALGAAVGAAPGRNMDIDSSASAVASDSGGRSDELHRLEAGHIQRRMGHMRFRGFLEPQFAGGHEASWRH